MQPQTAEQLAELAIDLGLVTSEQVQRAWSDAGGTSVSTEKFGATLLRRELITRYQLDRLLRGDHTGYFFGAAKILYQVGAGAFARVYRAEMRDSGETVAVKVLRNRFSQDEEKCKEFRREGEMGRLLRHPHIVAIEDVGEANNTSYITMEFVEGQTLRELVKKRGALDILRTIDLMKHLCAGLEYAHKRGVTHRDLKGSNVLVSTKGVAKLADFGLAAVDKEYGDEVLGRMHSPRTVEYAALEKLTGMRNDNVRSDIYFMGALAYLALTGVSPLGDSRDRAARSDPRRFLEVVPLAKRAPDLPADVRETVTQMMHLEPLERYQSITDVLRVFEELAVAHAPGGKASQRKVKVSTAPSVTATAGVARVMLVERSGHAQDALRDFLGQLGYRVLVTENAQRALKRFSSTPFPAEGIVFSASKLGMEALDAFNTLTADPFYAKVPAVLLLGGRQADLGERANCDELRKVITSPIEKAAMQETLDSILATKA
ncbi:MAG: protein kinase domain-containing protein [Pirellulales bacterium]